MARVSKFKHLNYVGDAVVLEEGKFASVDVQHHQICQQ